jgi:hypothetical protein
MRLYAAYQVGKEEEGFANGIRLVLTAMLQSPHFLYRIELGVPQPDDRIVALDAYELASRLSFFLWKSTPDDALLDAAEAGELDTPEGLRAQAERLLADSRADTAIVTFYLQLLGLDLGLAGLEKDPELFPDLDRPMIDAMLEETAQYVRYVYNEGDGTLDQLLTAPFSFINADLAPLYGVEPPASAFEKTDLDPAQRAGLLTQPGVMAVHAGFGQTSPTLRGKLVRNDLLCDVTPPPPPEVNEKTRASSSTPRARSSARKTSPGPSSARPSSRTSSPRANRSTGAWRGNGRDSPSAAASPRTRPTAASSRCTAPSPNRGATCASCCSRS